VGLSARQRMGSLTVWDRIELATITDGPPADGQQRLDAASTGPSAMWVNTIRWRVPKGSSDKQLELWREEMALQRSNPEGVNYIRSRFFVYAEEGSTEENWMALDEYECREDFDKAMRSWSKDPELVKRSETLFAKWKDIMVPKSRKREYWTEVEELRFEPQRQLQRNNSSRRN